MADYAYLAGLVDGDGYIGVRRRDKGKTLTDRARGISFVVLLKIGGEVKHLSGLREAYGNIGIIYVRKKEGCRHLAEWTIAGNQARALLATIEPFLILKKPQAQTAIRMPMPRSRWAATAQMREEQEAARQTIMQLNRLGRGRKEVSDGCRA